MNRRLVIFYFLFLHLALILLSFEIIKDREQIEKQVEHFAHAAKRSGTLILGDSIAAGLTCPTNIAQQGLTTTANA